MQRTRSAQTTHSRNARARSTLRWCVIGAMCMAILSCSDSNEYSPLGNGNDDAEPTTRVTGIVRDTDTTPVPDAVVTIEPTIDGISATVAALLDRDKNETTPQTTLSERRATVSDAQGRFTFNDIESGDYIVQAIADDHLAASRNISVPEAVTPPDTIIVDVVLTPTGSFTGTALLENGLTHESTVVYAEGTSYVGVTDGAGAYELTGVPLGTYTVRATHTGYIDDSKSDTITSAGEVVALATMNLLINSNIPPTAQILSPTNGFKDFPTIFSGAANDVDGTVVLYEWDFENDGIFETADSTTADASHVYTTAGTITAKLRVTDNQGGIGLAAVTFNVDETEAAIYMSVSTGNDANTGSPIDPVETLAGAYTRAGEQVLDLIIAETGVYNEVPDFQDGISIKGGRDLPSWTVDVGYTEFAVGESRATANNITSTTDIKRVRIETANQSGASNSIALYSSNSTSALTFEECWFTASNGGNASAAGSNGNSGATGKNGFNGINGNCDGPHGNGGGGGDSAGGCPGGAGGAGGAEGINPGQNGAAGSCSGGVGGFGGAPGVSDLIACPDNDGQPGTNGVPGGNGATGGLGSTVTGDGFVIGNEWVPSASGGGGTGVTGAGGGGGGGGGSQGGSCVNDGGGNGGGGGGGGGQGGTGGGGGEGGYGSFAVFLVNSSPTFNGCIFGAGIGGTGSSGGDGGDGVIGGNGGAGGAACTSEIGEGGNGGGGGMGGNGGGGAGGPGGASYCVYRAGSSSPAFAGETYITGSGGVGGLGGQAGTGGPFASNGPTGPSGGLF